MATEEFKLTVNKLFEDYVEFRKTLDNKQYSNVALSFREYLDFYIAYNQHALQDDEYEEDDDEYEEDVEDLTSEDDDK